MSELQVLLDEMCAAGAGLPDPDAEPEAVLEAVEQMMVRRQAAFVALQTAIERGGVVDADAKVAAAELSALDQRWKSRMETALRTLAGRLDGARKLRANRPRSGAHYVSLDL